MLLRKSASLAGVILLTISAFANAQDKPFPIAGGKFQLKAPASWVKKAPATTIVEQEFVVPATKPDAIDGRVTVMSAGGGVEANIDRWYGQFTQPDGSKTRDKAKSKKLNLAGEEVHIVDMSGTYKDQAGPMAPAVDRPNYRMLAAIISSKAAGDVFIKFYGPERTVTENEKAFLSMIEGLEKK